MHEFDRKKTLEVLVSFEKLQKFSLLFGLAFPLHVYFSDKEKSEA